MSKSAENVQAIVHFIDALKARGFTAMQIQDITAAAADSRLVAQVGVAEKASSKRQGRLSDIQAGNDEAGQHPN